MPKSESSTLGKCLSHTVRCGFLLIRKRVDSYQSSIFPPPTVMGRSSSKLLISIFKASHTLSMQDMVLAALQNGPHLDTYNAISRLIHVNIASAVQMIFLTTPASCNRPLEASLSYIQTVTYLKDARCVAVHVCPLACRADNAIVMML